MGAKGRKAIWWRVEDEVLCVGGDEGWEMMEHHDANGDQRSHIQLTRSRFEIFPFFRRLWLSANLLN